MIWLRNALIAAIAVVSFLLFLEWNKFQEKQHVDLSASEQTLPSDILPTPSEQQLSSEPTSASVEVPSAPSDTTEAQVATEEPTTAQLVSINTDTLQVIIDTRGGDIIKVALPKHTKTLGEKDPFQILNRTESHTYIAVSGIVGQNATDANKNRPIYSVSQTNFKMAEGNNNLQVDLVLQQPKATITKRFTFTRDSYLIGLEYIVDNHDDKPWQGHLYGQIKRDSYQPPVNSGPGIQPFLGAAITTDDSKFEKFDLDDLAETPFKTVKTGGWVAMIQHYFISAWIPDAKLKNNYEMFKDKTSGFSYLRFTSERTTVAPNSQGSLKADFYVGPKDIRVLESISPYLDLTVDYGWLWFIAKPLFFGLDWIHNIVGNWGVAIILLTMLIKLVFFYPSAMSYRSMAKMRKVQPLMADLKERFGDDRQKMSTELMKLYKKEKVNPLGGCLPMILQMPVFISLYWMIMESVELRHQPFMLWIADLSVKDPYFVLPLIMGATMFIQQRLNPTPPDPMQAKIMQMMPIVFTAMFLFFPSGLVLYWVVNNSLSIAQQWVITRQIEKAG